MMTASHQASPPPQPADPSEGLRQGQGQDHGQDDWQDGGQDHGPSRADGADSAGLQQPSMPTLAPEPRVHPTATLHATQLGRWTEVGERCVLNHVTLGDYSYIERDCDLMFAQVGRFTSIASSVRLNPSNHPWWRPTLHHFTYRPGKFGFTPDPQAMDPEVFAWREKARVLVGHDVWIGHGAIVLPGVRIGNGAIVGAGSVVTRDVAPYTIVVGNPARVLRPRFDSPEIAERLEAVGWWHWPHDKLQDHLTHFQGDALAFLEAVDAISEEPR